MNAHDRAAVRAAPRFSLTVSRWSHGSVQTVEFDGLTERQIEERKAFERECWPAPGYELSFDVTRV